MKNKLPPYSFFTALWVACGLAACTGMSPGGGAPAEVAQGGGAVAIGNSLDAGSGGGPAPIGGGSSGEAVPSTQQSTDAIGAPCIIRFKVTVKVLRNGSEETCMVTTARMAPLDVEGANTGTMAPPEDNSSPRVNLNFSVEPDSPFNANETHATTCVEGRWVSAEEFMFRYPGVDLNCEQYHVSAQAHWMPDNTNFSSNLFQGPPVPERNEDYAVPLELTLDLGGRPQPVYNENFNADAVFAD